MSKCPKCKYTLSSSDVLCPKCGALVEEINTNAALSRSVNDAPETEDDSGDSSSHDHYENIILYNETFPIIDSEPPSQKEAPPAKPEEEQEDFDIEDILSDQSGSKHVNPLLAHIEKQMSSERDEYQDVISEDDEYSGELPEDEEAADYEETADSIEEPQQFEDEETQQDALIAEEEPRLDEPEDEEENNGEYYAEASETVDKDLPSPIAIDELQELAKEITQSAKEPKEDFSISGVPAYSEAYLEAIRNADVIEEEELEIDEFDPKAYMEKFKSENMQEQAEENKTDEQTEQAEPVQEEEPVRRRYNPNRPKPKYDESEMQQEEPQPDGEKKEEAKEEPEEKAKQDATQPEPVPEEEEKKETNSKEEDDVLELELDPARFFIAEEDQQETEDERFIIEQEEPTPKEKPEPAKETYNFDTGSEKDKKALIENPLSSTMSSSSSRRIPVWASALIWIVIAGRYILRSLQRFTPRGIPASSSAENYICTGIGDKLSHLFLPACNFMRV